MDADYSKSEEALKAAKLTQLRQRALIKAMDNNVNPELEADEQAKQLFSDSSALFSQEQLLTHSQYVSWKAQKQKLETDIKQRQAEIHTARLPQDGADHAQRLRLHAQAQVSHLHGRVRLVGRRLQ